MRQRYGNGVLAIIKYNGTAPLHLFIHLFWWIHELRTNYESGVGQFRPLRTRIRSQSTLKAKRSPPTAKVRRK